MKRMLAGFLSYVAAPGPRLVAAFVVSSWTVAAHAEAVAPARLSVVTTIAPIAMIVREIGGDHLDATCLVSGSTDVHTYEPAPSDLVRIASADLIVSIGGDLDNWLEKLVAGKKPEAVVIRLLDDGVAPTASEDPHAWLDPVWVRDRALASLVRGLSAIDAATAPQYAAAARRVAGDLTNLDEDVREILSHAAVRAFVAFHPAWNWFAARYDLHPVGAIEEGGGVGISAARLAAVLDGARKEKVSAILVEPQMDPRMARTVAADIGADIVQVDPLGDPASADRATYRDLMIFNARAFARALGIAPSGAATGSLPAAPDVH